MDNQKHPEQPKDDRWLDDLLAPQDVGSRIGPDEQAVSAAGLKNPGEQELDALMAEFGSQQPESVTESAPSANSEYAGAPFRDQEFRDTFGEGKELEAAFQNDAAPAEITTEEEPPVETNPKRKKKEKPAKRRPSHKKGYGLFGIPHILATVIWLGLAVVIGATAGRVLWLLGADVLAFGQVPKTVTITIAEDDTIEDVAQQLKDAELIKYPELFVLFGNFTGKAEEVDPGSYTLNKPDDKTGEIPGIAYDYNALFNSLHERAPSRETVNNLLIPEGYTCAQIFALLEEKGVCTAAELEEYAANGELNDYWFLEGVERGDKYCLEGYLFPDTYNFYKNDDPKAVLQKMLNAFDNRFTEKMQNSLAEINNVFAEMMRKQGRSEEYIASHTIGIREVVIIASMIEKESPGADESYTISSVIYNRLASSQFNLLQIDATVVYACGGSLENLDYSIDSPYNTYVRYGLPIGPISNPGRDSLDAALNPESTNYYYYALYPGTRKHEFFNKLSDFEKFLRENGYYD